MKSNDFPGNPKSSAMHGLRTPETIPAPQVSRASARAAMLEKAGLNAKSEVEELSSTPVFEGEWPGGETTLADIPVSRIVKSPFQPRIIFDEKAIEELATSIQTIGLGKPIITRPLPNGTFELIGGERRWRAVQLNGTDTIKSIVQPMSDSMAMMLSLTDNSQEDLTDYELARSYHRILECKEEQSQRSLARRLGINVSIVNRCLTLMQLPDSIRTVLDRAPGLITSNYAKRFVDYADSHLEVVEKVVRMMGDTGLQQEAALRMIAKEILALSRSPDLVIDEVRAVEGVGTMKVAGTRLEFKCEKGIDPQRLSKSFEEFLRALDIDSVRVRAE